MGKSHVGFAFQARLVVNLGFPDARPGATTPFGVRWGDLRAI